MRLYKQATKMKSLSRNRVRLAVGLLLLPMIALVSLTGSKTATAIAFVCAIVGLIWGFTKNEEGTSSDEALKNNRNPVGLALLLIFLPALALAGGAGTRLPWNDPLDIFSNNLTGPTAAAAITVMFVVAGLIWGFTKNEEGARRFVQGIMGAAIVLGAAGLVAALSIAGATL